MANHSDLGSFNWMLTMFSNIHFINLRYYTINNLKFNMLYNYKFTCVDAYCINMFVYMNSAIQ